MRYCDKSKTFEYGERVYDVSNGSLDTRHGGPFDRGSADSYYGRGCKPHYFVGGTNTSDMITDLTDVEFQAYMAGFEFNENIEMSFKEW